MTHDAVLLAAGGSRRLGRAKQLLTRQGVPLVRYVADLLLQTQPARLVVITGGSAEAVEETLQDLPLEVCRNLNWETGMATSIQCAARTLKDTQKPILIAGTDQPRLILDHLTRLRDAPPNLNVVSQYTLKAGGIPVRITPETLAQAFDLEDDKGFRDLWKNTPPLRIEAPDLLEDLDTPTQLADAVKAGWIEPPR